MWFSKISAKTPSKRRRRAATARFFRPRLEELGQRIVPSTDTWIGPTGGLWSNPANWSLGRTPQSTDMLVTGSTNSEDDLASVTVISWQNNGSTILIDRGKSVTGQQYVMDYGTLSLAPGSTVASDNYIYEYGTILSSTGFMMISSATLSSPNVILEPGSLVSILGGSSTVPALKIQGKVEQYGVLNDGSATTAGFLSVSSTYVINTGSLTTLFTGSKLSPGSLDVEGALDMKGASISTTGVTLNGTLESDGSGGTGDSITGNMNVGGGTLEVFGGGHTLSLTGNYSQSTTGTFWTEIANIAGGTALPFYISGSATLHGTLRVTVVGGGTLPPFSQTWFVMEAAGGFQYDFDAFDMPPGRTWVEAFGVDPNTGNPVYKITD